jgi:hypothetical protein
MNGCMVSCLRHKNGHISEFSVIDDMEPEAQYTHSTPILIIRDILANYGTLSTIPNCMPYLCLIFVVSIVIYFPMFLLLG